MEDDDFDISAFKSKLKGAKSKKKSGGGFQSMGLSLPVLRAVLKRGYKIPTPIQRLVIPMVMEGRNVVAMSRTGSGKTAAFLIPMLERLKCRIAKTGARALIFSPTRELAIQTMKLTKELAVQTNLKATLVLGGEKIEHQFAAIHESPDIIIATPGRFLHVVVEMDLKLSSVEYVVFDEADRLFEMGSQEELQEVLNRLPSERQVLLVSATLPSVLHEFAHVAIEYPKFIQLNVETQISENLKSSFLLCRNGDKPAALLYLLTNVIDLSKGLTVVFFPTKDHVEYMEKILERASIPCSCMHSQLDQTQRNIQIGKFRAEKVRLLLATDIVARGIDIPLLDNVINFNFPASPKHYVHRVGRVTRDGRSGKAFSLVSSDEAPFLLDLHLFLNKPLKFSKADIAHEDGLCGSVPQSVIDDEADTIQSWHKLSVDMKDKFKVTKNAHQRYLKLRSAPSNESIKRMKSLDLTSVQSHPMFNDKAEFERNKLLISMKNFRPNTTIFELGQLAKTHALVMREKRKMHGTLVKNKPMSSRSQEETQVESKRKVLCLVQNFHEKEKSEHKNTGNYKDPAHYLSYMSAKHYTEKGLGLESTFERQAASAVLDLIGDDGDNIAKKSKNVTRWDRKKKKFIRGDDDFKAKKMKTESGVWIPKTYKSDIYKKWLEKNKVRYQDESENEEESQVGKQKGFNNSMKKKPKVNKGKQHHGPRPIKRELKTKEEILKTRKQKEKLISHQKKKNKLRVARYPKKR